MEGNSIQWKDAVPTYFPVRVLTEMKAHVQIFYNITKEALYLAHIPMLIFGRKDAHRRS